MSRDHPPRTVFHRNRPDFDLRDTGEPDSGRVSAVGGGDDRRQKVRVSAGSNPISDYPRIPSGVPTVTDTLQNTRMDEIERAIRALTDDMARNRSTFSALLGELRGGNGGSYQPAPVYVSRPSNGHAKDAEEDAGEIAYLIERVERNVESKFKELARAWSVLGDRLGVLERSVEEFDGGGEGRVLDLTPELEARLKTLSFADDRLEKFETLLTALPQRLTEMERRLQSIGSDAKGGVNSEVIIGKIDQLERLLMEGGSGDDSIEIAPILSSLRDVEAGLRGIGGQLREVDNRNGDVNLAVEGLGDRQKRMEDLIEAQQSLIVELKQELREDIGNAFTGRPDGTEVITASVGSAVSERFAGLSSQMNGRIGQLEDLVRSAMDRPPTVVNASGDVDTGFLTEAMTKIINNQHTLAGSIDEWRSQSRQDVSAITMRIDGLERQPVVAPVMPQDDRFGEITEQLRQIRSTMPERQGEQPVDGWSRFKLWLFGTNDWYAASWIDDRGDDRGWTAPRRSANVEHQEAPAERVYERNAYDNQRA